jgi:hypothetical protein
MLFSGLWGCPLKAVAQNVGEINQSISERKVLSWESPARLRGTIRTEKGALKIGEEGFEFRSTKDRFFKLPFVEVQTFFLSPRKLVIETFQNREHRLPGMQHLRFDLERAVPPEIAAELSTRVWRPSQNAVPDPASKGIDIPAHHRTLTGGTNGTLRFSDNGIGYVTDVRGDSRSWRWADLQTLSDPDPYHLLVFGYRDTYTFDLKAPLPQGLFYRLVDAVDAQDSLQHGQRPITQSPGNAEEHLQGGRE